MKVLNTWMKYFGRYFIYAVLGLFIPSVIDNYLDADTWQYWVVLITTAIVLVSYMSIRDLKYFKHEEWMKE
jgi:hypothetical protein